MKKIINKIFIGILTFCITTMVVNAASGTVSISGVSTTTTGSTITVTVTARASNIFYWQLFTTYDSSRLKLVSGDTTIQGEAENATTGIGSVSRTYRFTAIKTGPAYIRVTSGGSGMNITTAGDAISYPTTTKNITINAPAPKSTNNNLSALLIDGVTFTPEFNKNTLEYSVLLDATVTSINVKTALEDPKAVVTGNGVISVVEGLNTINLVVTSESGVSKTYIVLATVKELTPIIVKIDNVEYTVARKKEMYEAPQNFEETIVKINKEDVLAYKNKKLNLTVLGLKDKKGIVKLYTYNGKEYQKYNNVTINSINLYLKDIPNKKVPKGYERVDISIEKEKIAGLSYKDSKTNYLLYGINTLTGKENIYSYDKKNNTLQIYYPKYSNDLLEAIKSYQLMCIGLFSVSLILLLVLILFTVKKKNIKKQKIKKAND